MRYILFSITFGEEAMVTDSTEDVGRRLDREAPDEFIAVKGPCVF